MAAESSSSSSSSPKKVDTRKYQIFVAPDPAVPGGEPQLISDVSGENLAPFGTAQNMIEDCGNEYPLHCFKHISKHIVELFLEFATYHIQNPGTYAADPRNSEDLGEWDRAFFGKLTTAELFEMQRESSCLDYPELVETCAKAIANMLKKASAEEIRRGFGIPEKK
jgi:hypothetical protein